ncbi:hypothetical protein NIE33_35860 [Paraburkholderia madseniana]|nr:MULTISPECIES: hypothetical protein [Paraburkholderia]MCX4176705.1 hypothetical protein [Paraburkholderia madseniana]MDQ6464696.1 hypothetical protein [Paraburkholderia madseniana]
MSLESVIGCVQEWWNRVDANIDASDLYLFGSSIYRDGLQFDWHRSDLDLVALIPESKRTAVDRYEWLVELAKHKQRLELDLVPLLQRENAGMPAVSLIPLTTEELRADVHKSKVKHFFADNEFLNIRTKGLRKGIPRAGDGGNRSPLILQGLEYAQELRC